MDDVGRWLDSLGLGRYADAFADNAIAWEHLPDLDHPLLEAIGVTAVGHRMTILKAVQRLGDASEVQARPETAQPSDAPARSGAEHRHLTVMFCDLVDSTAMVGHMDVEDYRELLGSYQDIARGAIEQYGGFVARYVGDGLLVYFGYPSAHEDDPERAVRAALRIVDDLGSFPPPAPGVQLQVRIGIATGDVIVGDIVGEGASEQRAALGGAPNLAARLQSEAEPGAVLVSNETRRLLRSLFGCEHLGQRTLKGFDEPVPVWRVDAERAADDRFSGMHAGNLTPFVGRLSELSLLRERWQQACSGEGQAVVISGEAGIGKSRLLRALNAELQGEALLRLQYQCSPYLQNSALHPVIRRLERAAGFTAADDTRARLEKLRRLLWTNIAEADAHFDLVSDLVTLHTPQNQWVRDLSPEQRRQATIGALRENMLAMAELQPLMLVFEDTHWSDPTTLDLIQAYVQAAASTRALILVTCRPEVPIPWINQSNVTSLSLSGLSRRDRLSLLAGVLEGNALPVEVTDEIVSRTEGIPLHLEEMARSVVESGAFALVEGRYVRRSSGETVGIPSSLRDSLSARLDRLGAHKLTAQTAAVIGREFSWELLQAISDVDDDALARGLETMARMSLVFAQGKPPSATYKFCHALVRDAAYLSLLKSEQRRIHERIAETLSRSVDLANTEPELLAHHFAEAGNTDEAIRFLRRAADRSLAASANQEAVRHLHTALELHRTGVAGQSSRPRELELLELLGVPLVAVEGYASPRVEKNYLDARQLLDTSTDGHQFPVLRGLWNCWFTQGKLEAAATLAAQLIDLAEAASSPAELALAHRADGCVKIFRGQLSAGIDALRRVRTAGVGASSSDVLIRYGQDPRIIAGLYEAWALGWQGHGEEARRLIESNVTLARGVDNPHSLCFALSIGGFGHMFMGHADAAQRYAHEASILAKEHQFPQWISYSAIMLGWVRHQSGDSDVGLNMIERGWREWLDNHAELSSSKFAAFSADCCIALGNLDRADELIAHGLSHTERFDERFHEAELYRHQGRARRARGEQAGASASFRRATEVARELGMKRYELRAALELARDAAADGRAGEERARVAALVDDMTGDHDEPDLVAARGLLRRELPG